MTFLRRCALALTLVFGLSLAACTGVGCKTDKPPVYPDPVKPVGESHKGAQEQSN
jgi:hypothetical protein